MKRRHWSSARLAMWLPGSAGLCLVGWLVMWRAAPFAYRLPSATGSILAGVCADILLLFSLVIAHRAAAREDMREPLARVVRVGVTAIIAGMSLARALDVVATELSGKRIGAPFLSELAAHPEWLWGIRWLLAAALLSVPLCWWALRADALAAERAVLALGLDARSQQAGRFALASGLFALSVLLVAVIGGSAGAAGETRIVLAKLSTLR